jgi:penicillin-binding protein 1A
LVLVVVVASLGLAAIGVAMSPPIASLFTAFHGVARSLPSLAPLKQRSLVFDATGNQIGIFSATENREPFALTAVPKDVIDAVLAVEDAGFYRHKGVDAKSLLRAMLANVSAGEVRQGGSTITQQLVKNSLLTSSQDTHRKILEAAYAVQLEKQWTKDQILERYLNTIYFGNGAYGLQAAAETYFGKDVGALDMIEGVFLAGLIRNPVGYDPITHSDRSRIRFGQGLDRLVTVGKLTADQAKQTLTDWKLPPKLARSSQENRPHDYFQDQVKEVLLNKTNILGDDSQQRYNALYQGGLRIYTTLDPVLQQKALDARASQMPDTANRFQAAMISEETKTGAVRAVVGGPGWEVSQINLTQHPFQTGSSAKFLILTAGINAGVQNNDLLDGSTNCLFPVPGQKDPYNPAEDAVRASGPLEQMTWKSINCAFTRLYLSLGAERVLKMAHDMGVKGNLEPFVSFAAGGNAISPADMASAFETIANNGVHHDPYYIDKIERADGTVLYQHQDPGTQVLTPEVADRTIDILRGVLISGTGRRGKLADNRPAAGKTGTQELNTNAWFVGGTPQYTTAVWMGNPNENQDQMVNVKEFKAFSHVQGGTYPVLMWKAYMDAAHEGLPVEDWPKPPANPRKAATIYLPGTDCLYRSVAIAAPPATGSVDPAAPTSVAAPSFGVQVVRSTTTTTVAGAPIDLKAPAPSIAGAYSVYSCKSGGPPRPRAPKPATTTTAGGPPASAPPATDAPAPPKSGG